MAFAMITSDRYNKKMTKRYLIPSKEAHEEIRVANSRFIATIAPVFSVNEARAFIQRIREEYPDAAHHVPAFVVGHGSSVTAHCNDDGEPSGTAGRPALASAMASASKGRKKAESAHQSGQANDCRHAIWRHSFVVRVRKTSNIGFSLYRLRGHTASAETGAQEVLHDMYHNGFLANCPQ